MDKKGHFEKKIKEHLENYAPDFDESAWNDFVPMLDQAQLPIWKRWYSPYIYSTILMALGLLLLHSFMGTRENPSMLKSDNHGAIDFVIRDTVFVYDTVYIYRQTHAIREAVSLGQGTPSPLQLPRESENSLEKTEAMEGVDINIPFKSNGFTLTKPELADTLGSRNADQALIPADPQTDKAIRSNSNHSYRSGSLKAPSINEQPFHVDRIEKEQYIGDTSNLSSIPLKQKRSVSFHLNPFLGLMLPANGQIEYRGALNPGLQMGINFNQKVGLYLGAVLGNSTGEIDDPEELSPSLVNTFPGMSLLPEAPDDIELRTKQWYFPLVLQLKSSPLDRIGFEGNFGLIGNYITSQRFSYIFEDESALPRIAYLSRLNEFRLSHLQLGIGTNYAFTPRFSFHVRTHYWLPLVRTGTDQSWTHGLGLGVGVDLKISR